MPFPVGGWHSFRLSRCAKSALVSNLLLTQGLLLEVGTLETLLGRGAFVGVVHEEEVEQSEPRRGQPGESLLQVVVRLLLQREVLQRWQRAELGPDCVRRGAWRCIVLQ